MSFDKKSYDLFTEYVKDFDENFTKKNKLPKSRDIRPIRFAVRDCVIGLLALKHQYKENVIEVGVFLTKDPDWIEGFSGTKVATLFILCDAYQCGSTMGIRFINKVEDGTIPINIIALADSLGIELKYITEGFITPKESRMLFLALTGFSEAATRRIMELSLSNLIAPERICYLVHHAIWTLEEMESILLGCDHPELILNGKAEIQDYLLYADVLYRTRMTIMGGFLDRKMRLKEVYEGEVFVDIEANDRDFDISFDSRNFAKVYMTHEDTPIPWVEEREDWVIPTGHRLVVAIRGYDWPDLHNNLERDIKMCREMFWNYADDIPTTLCILVPRDVINSAEESYRKKYVAELEEAGVYLMICPELLVGIDCDAQKRLQQMKLIRHDIATGEAVKRKMFVSKLPSDFNEIQLIFVSVPKTSEEGVVKLPQLIDQSLYDEKELANNVNRKNVEMRHHRVMDRIGYLGKLALMNPEINQIIFPGELFNGIATLAIKSFSQLRLIRLTKIVYPENLLEETINALKLLPISLPKLEELILFLKKAQMNQHDLIVLLDHHNKGITSNKENVVNKRQLSAMFDAQFVLDNVIDYSGKTDDQVVEETIWKAVDSAMVGKINMINLGELPHTTISRVLHYFSYYELGNNIRPVSLNITYTDGSQARPFPFFRLKKRSDEEMKEFRKIDPVKIGMLSCRHPKLNRIIDRYWLRNIDMKIAGRSSAEKDEFAYETTKEKLTEILKNKKPYRMYFYQTGFPPVVIGFYRAVVEFLMETQGEPPCLEVIPMIYDSHDDHHDQSKCIWY